MAVMLPQKKNRWEWRKGVIPKSANPAYHEQEYSLLIQEVDGNSSLHLAEWKWGLSPITMTICSTWKDKAKNPAASPKNYQHYKWDWHLSYSHSQQLASEEWPLGMTGWQGCVGGHSPTNSSLSGFLEGNFNQGQAEISFYRLRPRHVLLDKKRHVLDKRKAEEANTSYCNVKPSFGTIYTENLNSTGANILTVFATSALWKIIGTFLVVQWLREVESRFQRDPYVCDMYAYDLFMLMYDKKPSQYCKVTICQLKLKKNNHLSCNAGYAGLIPAWITKMLPVRPSYWAYALWSLHATTREPVCCN